MSRDYDDFFEGTVAEIVGLTRAVLDLAKKIRARDGFKTPDAIHLAAAVLSGGIAIEIVPQSRRVAGIGGPGHADE